MLDPTALRVKICGLREPDHVRVAVEGGASYVGLVFFAPSPRAVSIEAASALAALTPDGVARVGLFVDPSDAEIDGALAAVPLDMIQLHGEEPPARIAELRARVGLPVLKAVGVSASADLGRLEAYEAVADQILCDAKPPAGAAVPGGTGVTFDWSLLAGRVWRRPWLLAGGLSADNLSEAVRRTGARQVDVSSGVETARGVKSADKIREFCDAARAIRV